MPRTHQRNWRYNCFACIVPGGPCVDGPADGACEVGSANAPAEVESADAVGPRDGNTQDHSGLFQLWNVLAEEEHLQASELAGGPGKDRRESS
jgi:hypothetical protein